MWLIVWTVVIALVRMACFGATLEQVLPACVVGAAMGSVVMFVRWVDAVQCNKQRNKALMRKNKNKNMTFLVDCTILQQKPCRSGGIEKIQ